MRCEAACSSGVGRGRLKVFLGRDAVTGRKRYRQWGGFPTRRAAEQALTRQLELIRVGEYADAGTTTVGDFLDRWLERQRKERTDLGTLDPAELVFTKLDGTPLQPQNVSQAFGNIIRRDGLPTIRLHDLRHTAASLMLAAGVHPKIVSERLGHAGIQITLDRYSHVTAGLQAEAANVLARAVFEPRPDGDAP